VELARPTSGPTLEAAALHHADWTDGHIRGFLDVVEGEPLSEDGWTEYSRMFGTRLYAGSSEPFDEVEQGELPF
jgi:hypothetical protein